MLIDSEHLKQTITDLCEDWHCTMLSKEQMFSMIDREPKADVVETQEIGQICMSQYEDNSK